MRQDRGSYELFFKRPRKLKVDIKYQRSSETRVLDGNTGYRGANDGPLQKSMANKMCGLWNREQ